MAAVAVIKSLRTSVTSVTVLDILPRSPSHPPCKPQTRGWSRTGPSGPGRRRTFRPSGTAAKPDLVSPSIVKPARGGGRDGR